MRRRRYREEEQETHDRWLISYADFITLLFAFFVVMYAISMVNEGKYRVLSDALVSAFNKTPGTTGGAQVSISPVPGEKLQLPMVKPQGIPRDEAAQRQSKDRMRNMAKDIANALGPLVQSGQVRITEGALGITVEINASLLFAPGDARLSAEATRALSAVALVLTPTDFPIIVEGHTDNTPINTSQFPSNWELSGVRASSVVRLFIDKGVDAHRFTVTGYADQRPVADNALIEGRMRNRRVAITIESKVPDGPLNVQVLPKANE